MTKKDMAKAWMLDPPAWWLHARLLAFGDSLAFPKDCSGMFILGIWHGSGYALLVHNLRNPPADVPPAIRRKMQANLQQGAQYKLQDMVYVATHGTLANVQEYLGGFAHGIKCHGQERTPHRNVQHFQIYATLAQMEHVQKIEEYRTHSNHAVLVIDHLRNMLNGKYVLPSDRALRKILLDVGLTRNPAPSVS